MDPISAKERMIQALTDMLEPDETLMYPIYGTMEQGRTQHYGYFGFTENFLLIALISPWGKTVTYSTRIPLDIHSVKIQKSRVFKEHIININFEEGEPCRIHTYPRVLAIDSQKENLPRFLSYLKNKAPNYHIPNLNQINGTKIRRQYFNLILYGYLAMLLPVIPMIFILECKKQNVSIWNSWHLLWDIADEGLPVIAGFMLPLLLLSLGSKFIFGKTVAVVEHKGLYLDNVFIPWKDIKAVSYTPPHFSRHYCRAAYITVTIAPARKREFDIDISSFPLYGFRKLKKLLPRHTVRWAKGELPFTVFLAVLPTIIFLLVVLF